MLTSRQWHLATAESCTGGGIAARLTDVAGSSAWFDCGWVTYTNASKARYLGVDPLVLERHGAVSSEVALAMARGAALSAGTQVALSTTGIAGPSGGTPEKPVGLVWFAWVLGDVATSQCQHFPGNREEVRAQAVAHAIKRLVELLREATRESQSRRG